MYKSILIILSLTIQVLSGLKAETVKVNSVHSLQLAISTAKPGDHIVVMNGTYTFTDTIAIYCKGTAVQPVSIEAETVSGVEINGTEGFYIHPGSEYVIIKGFIFRQISGTFGIAAGATHCSIKRNIFECDPSNSGTKPYLNISGDDNEVSFNAFKNKNDIGQMVSVQGPGGDKMAKRTWIHHNYFYNFPPKANNCSAIQIGLSGRSMDSSFCVIEYNLFIKTAGENEGAICAKSCNNMIRFNTFGEGSDEVSLRHGNKSLVYGNYFINATGLRFSGDDHLIFGNHFQGCAKAIVCTNGDGEVKEGSKLTCHDRADRVRIVYNTITDCKTAFQMPDRNNGLGAAKITFANNVIRGGTPVSIQGSYIDPVWKENILWDTTCGDIPSSGYTIQNIKNCANPDSVSYPHIPATNRPLTVSDVGPGALIGSDL